MKTNRWLHIWKYAIQVFVCIFLSGHLPTSEPEPYKKIPKKDRIAFAIQQEFESTKDPYLGIVPSEKLYAIREELKRLESSFKRTSDPIVWEERGPNNIGGRTRAILIDKTDASGNTVVAGSVAGGIWKTVNAKSTSPIWVQTSGLMENLAVSCLIQDPQNTNILYAGTGEGYFNVDAQKGNGIWKSVNGGNTWTRIPSTASSDFYYTLNMGINSIGELFACTRNNGLMRSQDGGNSWTKILGLGQNAVSDRATDIVVTDDNALLVSMGLFETDGIYRSLDQGNSWEKLESGLPVSGYQRIELAGSASNPNLFYAVFQDEVTSNCLGIYKSTDQGDSWVQVNMPESFGMSNFARQQAWYNLTFAVDPNDQNLVVVGGIDLHVSRNGGLSWTQMSQWSGLGGYNYVHADQHAIVFEGTGSGTVFFGNDGGVARCLNIHTTVPSISHINNGYNVTQFYGAAIHPNGATPVLIAGAQDNGTQQFKFPGVNATQEVAGGDGSFCHIDQDNPNIQIASYVFNNYFVSIDGGLNFSLKTFNNSGRFANPSAYDSNSNKLYAANWGGSYFRWNNPAASGTDRDYVLVSAFGSSVITALTISPSVPNRAYFGLNDGKLVRVDDIDQGSSKTGSVILSGQIGNISSIAIDPDNDNHIIVSYSNYGLESLKETQNGGQSWVNVEGNLPDIPVRWVIFQPQDPNAAIIATELGIWRTDHLNGSNTYWYNEGNSLSYVRADMLSVRPFDNYLVAATHGRGLFSSSNWVTPKIGFANTLVSLSEQASSGTNGSCKLNNQNLYVPVTISSPPNQPVTVSVAVEDGSTALLNQDYQLLTSSLTFTPDGPLEKLINLRILDEAILENTETIKIKVNGDPNFIGDKDLATIHIIDDDMDPQNMSSRSWEIGQNSNTRYEYPFGGYYEDERTQILYKGEELEAAGMMAGNITKMALQVTQKNSTSPFRNFNVKLKNVNMNGLGNPGAAFVSGSTHVFSGDLSTVVGWNEIQFDQDFYWNGEDDILVDICFNNQAWSDDDNISTTQTSYTSVAYMHADGANGCSFISSGDISTERPDIKFFSSGSVTLADMVCSKNSTVIQGDIAHFYADGKLIASIENLVGGSISCMEMEIDRIGNGILYPAWAKGAGITQKTFYIDAMFNAPYKLSLYFTPDELSRWPDPMALNMLKTDVPISESNGTSFQLLTNNELTVETLPSGVIVYQAIFTDFSGFALTNLEPSILPLNLIRFEVDHEEKGNRASWEWTGNNEAGEIFLERSFDDPFHFERIAMVYSLDKKTEYLDEDIRPGNTYYRLSKFEQGINDVISPVRVIWRENEPGSEEIFLFPNPVLTDLNILFSGGAETSENLNIRAASGELVRTISHSPSNSQPVKISIEELTPGLYFLECLTESGEMHIKRFVKL